MATRRAGVTKEVNFKFNLEEVNLNSHTWLVGTLSDSMDIKYSY